MGLEVAPVAASGVQGLPIDLVNLAVKKAEVEREDVDLFLTVGVRGGRKARGIGSVGNGDYLVRERRFRSSVAPGRERSQGIHLPGVLRLNSRGSPVSRSPQ